MVVSLLVVRLVRGTGPRVLRVGAQLLVATPAFAAPVDLGLVLLVLLKLVHPLLLVQGLFHLGQGRLGLRHWLVCALSDLAFVSAVLRASRRG